MYKGGSKADARLLLEKCLPTRGDVCLSKNVQTSSNTHQVFHYYTDVKRGATYVAHPDIIALWEDDVTRANPYKMLAGGGTRDPKKQLMF